MTTATEKAPQTIPSLEEVEEAAVKRLDREHRQAVESVRKYGEHWEAVRAALSPFVGTTLDLDGSDSIDISPESYLKVSGISIHYHTTNLSTVAPMVRALVTAGFELMGTDDYADLGRRRWKFRPRGSEDRDPTVNLMAFVPWNDDEMGPGCRVVKRKKEIEVSEIVCPDDEAPATA